MSRQLELVWELKTMLGEAPVWEKNSQSLYFVDILEKKLYIYETLTGNKVSYDMPSYISCFAIGDDGYIYVMLIDGLYRFDEETKTLTYISSPEDHDSDHRFNDGKCDSKGRFYVGSMENTYTNSTGSLYYIDETMTFKKVLHHAFTVPNGLAWNDAIGKFYHVDTIKKDVNAYEYDSITGKLGEKKTIIHFEDGEGSPDGMVIDDEGMLWIAHWDAYKIGRWDPMIGNKIDEIAIPCERPTSLAFGGNDMKDLYITTASLEDAKGLYAGSLYKVRVEVGGQHMTDFRTNK